MNIIGFIISVPVFYDSGFVIFSSLNKALSKKSGIKLAVFAIALATGLYTAHVFIPPTPGRLAAVAVIEADLGLVMLLGILVAIPVSLVGYVWASFIGKNITTEEAIVTEVKEQKEVSTTSNSLFITLLPLLLPIVLIALKSMAEYPAHPFGQDWEFTLITFIGNPIIALLIGVIVIFISTNQVPSETKNTWVAKSMKESGAINTTVAVIAPLLAKFGLEEPFEKALSVLAVGAGAMTLSHINDSYFGW